LHGLRHSHHQGQIRGCLRSTHCRYQQGPKEGVSTPYHQQRFSPEVKNKELYGQSYYQDKLKQLKTGYVHPYHTSENPLVMTHYSYMKTLFEAVGPEQVSPHYESLSRSRRGVLFMFGYIGAIVSISRLGGWSHNEWIRGMVFHHEFLITFYLGYIETRHFVFMPGPKFTIFYNTYARYETQQLNAQWADMVEQQ
jgi:hypothetical protein